jgi:thioredoxin-related protein
MLFIFGSHRCQPCLDLKKKIESQNIGADFDVVYLPLRYYPGGGSGKDDSSTHELCIRLFKESGSEMKPWSCRGMPTLFLMNPSTRAVKELPASIAQQDTKAKLLDYYKGIAMREPTDLKSRPTIPNESAPAYF